MNPPASEPILSLPIGVVVVVLLLIVGGAALLLTLLFWRIQAHRVETRRGQTQQQSETFQDAVEQPSWSVDALKSLLNGLAQGALVVDTEGSPLAWNRTAAQTLALDGPSPALPIPLALLALRALDAGAAETTEIALPQATPLRATASPLGDTTGRGALILLHTAQVEADSAEAYRRLLSTLAHELRTPLTAILGHADILKSCQPGKDEVLWRRSRDFIASEADRLARLVEDLLTLSRLDLTPLQQRPVNLRAVVEEAISALFQAAQARGVRLALQSPPDLPRVSGDRDRLYQVFINLLDNAIKYTRPDGGEAVVRLTSVEGRVQVDVHDDGAGIAPQDLPHIFDPLYRSPDVSDLPGTGLGLTIVRAILEQHGTHIDAESEPGQGTSFRFSLGYTPSGGWNTAAPHTG
ncbi:MAG: HAMP domain-containing histidine kinase [Anaerolineae bacterium]|nr:HAMP domain-containing histidine kinase [Anaerolineae bacterium]